MKHCLILIILLLTFSCFAQEDDQNPKARLLDEYSDLNGSSIKARTDNISKIITDNAEARVYIITYHTRYEPPGKNLRFAHFVKRDLEMRVGIAAKRIVTVDAGESSCSSRQIWLVPEGTTPEIKRSYKTIFDDTSSPFKFDEHPYSFPEDGIEYTSGDSFREFAAAVKRAKASAFIYVYKEGKDQRGATARMQREIRNSLIKDYALPARKIEISDGGYRKFRGVEFWILPRGVHPPVATPNVFPKVGRRRK